MAILIIFKKYIYKVKKFIILLILIIFIIFKNLKKRYFLPDDTYYINKYLTLKNKSECLNETLIIKEKLIF